MYHKACGLTLVLILLIGQAALPGEPAAASRGGGMLTAAELGKIIKERNGKVLFLNVWATWCKPCVEEFPEIVKLHKQYGKKGLDVVTLSVDFPEDSASKVGPFLKKSGAEFINYIAVEKEAEKIINLLSSEWSGAIPATFVFDNSGKLAYYTIGTFNYEVVAGKIKSLLRQ